MAYFSQFPRVDYDVRGDGIIHQMTDITRRIRFKDYMKRNYVTFDYYDVKSGETPEYIADQFYGDPELHWVILLTNDVMDIYTDWPMKTNQFEAFVASKYDDPNGIHHYCFAQESGDSTVLIDLPNDSATTLPAGALAVTNYEHEEKIQEEKRRIRLIQPRFIDQIKKEFKNKMNG